MKKYLLVLLLISVSASAEVSTLLKIEQPKKRTPACQLIDWSMVRGRIAPVGAITRIEDPDLYQARVCGYVRPVGQVLDNKAYSVLYGIVKCTFGCPDSRHFRAPDVRGVFGRK